MNMEDSTAQSPQDMDWGGIVSYLTNPTVNVPPNRAAGAHSRWSQTLPDNGAVRSAMQTASMFAPGYDNMSSFAGGAAASQDQQGAHVGDAQMDQDSYGEGMAHGS
jgi:hypothetical protein